jgi:CPA1 family monovalent cation:H+ antiporter
MRGKDDFTSDSCGGFVESDTLFLHAIAYRLQNCESAVTLVEVKDARRYSHCLQGAKSSDSQQQFLPDPDVSVTAIQSRRQIPVYGRISFNVGIQKKEIDATDLHSPHPSSDQAVERLHLNHHRLAVGAVATGALSGWSIAPTLLVVTAGSFVLGLVLARLTLLLNARITDVSTVVVVQFCGTFFVWLLAERLHLSGIITTVVFAMSASRSAPEVVPARIRVRSFAVWEVAVFVLNVLAFILIGLQLKPILGRLAGAELLRYLTLGGAVCAAVIVVRIVWVMGFLVVGRWLGERRLKTPGATIVAWCGMRGIVTLAAALALPAIPYRDLILFTAFSVVLVTLVVQGMTVTPLMRALDLRDDGSVDREVRQARVETLRAGLAAVDDGSHDGEMVAFLRRKYAARLRHA